MSISSHYHGVPANHITIPGPPSNVLPSYGNHYSSALNPAGQGQAITYSQVTEVPYYTGNPGKISSISYNGISGTTVPPQVILVTFFMSYPFQLLLKADFIYYKNGW